MKRLILLVIFAGLVFGALVTWFVSAHLPLAVSWTEQVSR